MTATARADVPLTAKTWHRYEWLLLGLIVALGASLRIARARFEPLGLDELWHLELTTGRGSLQDDLQSDVPIAVGPALTKMQGALPSYSIWTHMTGVVHPPLFVQLLRFWRDVFGPGDMTARTFCIILSLVAIVMLYIAGRSLHGPEPALWATLIFAVAPTQVWLHQQVRGYGMLQAVCMATLFALIKLEQSPTPSIAWAIALGIGLLLMMLTHYFAVAGALAIGLYILIRLRGRKLALATAVIAGAAVIYLIIWLPFLLPQFAPAHKADNFISEPPGAAHVLSTLQRAITWPARLVAEFDINNPIAFLFGGMFIAPLFGIRRRPERLLWYLWLLFTIGFITVLDLTRGTKQLTLARYVSPAAPVCFMLFAAMASRHSMWLKYTALISVTLAALALTPSTYTYDQADWPAVAKVIDDHVSPNETLVYYAPPITEVYYLTTSHYSRQFPRPILKLSHPASADLVRQIPGSTAWLMTSDGNKDIAADLPGTTVIERFDFPPTPFQPALVHVRLPDRSMP